MKILSSTIKSYDSTYKSGYDKDYPSLELVRIEKIFFKKKGSCLDFGCGPGTNGIHLLKKGYNLTFCDISEFALKKVKKKIQKLKIKKNFKILNLHKNKKFFLENKNKFDFIICFSVLNNFKDKKTAKEYMGYFYKILKKKGKIIIDSNLHGNHNYKIVNKKKNLFTTNPKNNYRLKMFFPKKKEFIDMMKSSGFKINDIGLSSFKVFSTFEKEIIISATKN